MPQTGEAPTQMGFNCYQVNATRFARYPDMGLLIYPTLGMVGEAGEIAEKVKKLHRDQGGILTEERRQALKLELGDVLWYISQVAREANLDLEGIARANIEKLSSRSERGKINGDGDNR